MNEQQLVDQMLAMDASQKAQPSSPEGSTDPVVPATNAASPAATAAPATEGAPTATAQAAASDTPPQSAPATSAAPKAPTASAVEKPLNLEEQFDRSSKAFAEQRIKLRQYEDLMARFASSAKIEGKNPEEIYGKLSGIITTEEAKVRNLDPAILRTLQDQEAKLAAYEQEEIKKEANASFIDLQKQFNLSTKEVESFGRQLSSEGINPFATRGINLSQHYLSMNYTKLIERAREQGRAEEAERQKRVAQSTLPGQTTGQSPAATAQTNISQSTGDAFTDFAKILGIR